MIEHPSEEELQRIAEDGPDAVSADAREHVARCVTCAVALADYRALRTKLEELPRAANVPAGVWSRIARSIEASGRASSQAKDELFLSSRPFESAERRLSLRPRLAQIAAGLTLFCLGGGAGFWARGRTGEVTASSAESAAVPPARSDGDGLGAAANIQRAGSEYVATLAAMLEQGAGADSVTRRQGREVALATIDGAVRVLSAAAPADGERARVAAVAAEVQRARGLASEGSERRVRF